MYIFNGTANLKTIKLTDCLKGNGLELAYTFQNCTNLQNLEMTRVGTGKGTSMYRFFNNVGNSIPANTTCTWKFTDVGNNGANLRSMFYNSLGSAGIANNSSLTWTNSGNRGNAVSMGRMFGPGMFDAESTRTQIDNNISVYEFDYTQGARPG